MLSRLFGVGPLLRDSSFVERDSRPERRGVGRPQYKDPGDREIGQPGTNSHRGLLAAVRRAGREDADLVAPDPR